MTVNPGNIAAYPAATLYVGDLDPEVTEAQLYEKFTAVGPVTSIRVCRDQITKQSLGYAYVNFQQPAEAERALDTMNFDMLCGKPMRLMWSQRDPALRRSGIGNVFIKNLDKCIDNKALYDTFSTFGNILSCKIMIDENGESKGFGFVHFETQEAADKAIESANNMLINKKIVYVGRFLSRDQRIDASTLTVQKFTNVFVKNFAGLLDDVKLRKLFDKFGEITSAVVMRTDDGRSKGFGFVNFKEPESAAKAVKEMSEYVLNDRKLFVGPFQKKLFRVVDLKKKYEEKKRERMAKFEGVNLYIKNLDEKIDDETLRKEFSIFGTVTSAKVMTEHGRSKGFGFVCFSTPEQATRAVTEMRGRIVGTKPLYVALAQRKEERRSQLISQYKNRIASLRMSNQQAIYVPPGMFVPTLQNPNIFNNQAMLQNIRSTPRWPTSTIRTPQPTIQTFQGFQTFQTNQAAQQRSGIPIAPYQTMTRLPTANRNVYNGGIDAPGFVKATVTLNDLANGPISPFQQQQQQNQQARQNITKKNPVQAKEQNATNTPNNQYPQAINVPGQEPLTTDMLASAPPQEQKQLLGERLFPLILNMYPEAAGKITGMLLEIDNAELLHMLDSRQSLKDKVDEAMNVLNAHRKNQLSQLQVTI